MTPTREIAIRRRGVGRALQASSSLDEDAMPVHPEPTVTTHVTTEDDGAVVLRVSGEIDLATAPVVAGRADEAHRLAAGGGRRLLVIDLSGVVFLASIGVGILADHRNRAISTGVTVAIVAGNPAVARVLALTGLDDVIAMHATLGDALATA